MKLLGLRWRPSGGALRIALALCLVISASILFWASRDYAVIAPDWDGLVRGVAYTPKPYLFRLPAQTHHPERIDRDLKQLSEQQRTSEPIRLLAGWTVCRKCTPLWHDGVAWYLDRA